MDEFSDHFKSAFKGTVRGVKKGYRLTKKALKDIPVDSLKPGNKHRKRSNSNVRHLHDHKQNVGVHQESDEHVEDSEGIEMESLDGEPLTDEQVQLQVDRKFFDRTYDAVMYELTHMTPSYTDIDEEILNEKEAMNSRILDLRQKCKIVSTTLEKRVLAHYAEFVQGIEDIRMVNDSLLQTSSDCKKARVAIRKSKAIAASQVALLGLNRTRTNVADTMVLLEVMKRIVWRRSEFAVLVSSGKLSDAMKLLKEEGSTDIENRLTRVHSIRILIEKWHALQNDPRLVEQCVEAVLTDCLTHRFVESTYCSLVESSTVVGTPQELGNQVGQLLWCVAAQILTRSLLEISQRKDESAPIASLAEEIQPKHLLLCICQMAARLVDFFSIYTTILRIHGEESRRRDSAFADAHAHLLHCVDGIGRRIGNDLLQKLTLVITHAKVDQLDLTRGLHLFVVVDMLVEAVKGAGADGAELASARTQLRARLESFVATQFQLPKAAAVLWGMMEDSWTMSDLSALSLRVVRPITSKAYHTCMKTVRAYVEGAKERGARAATHENPFYAAEVIDPQDLDRFLQTETFGQYWTRVKNSLDSGSPRSLSDTATSPRDATPEEEDSFAETQDSTVVMATGCLEDVLKGTLAANASIPPTVLTSSAISLCNTLTEYAARVVVRYSPLAANMINWTSDLVSLYIYTIADNFVSISKSVPIERQSDFSQRVQDILAEMHVSSERSVGAVNGCFSFPEQLANDVPHDGNSLVRFPPRIWDRIRQEYASGAHHYALVNRVVACESCIALVFQQEALVCSFAQLLPGPVAEEHFRRIKDFYGVATELLHMCIYRVCQAIYPMESVCAEISKLRPKKDEIQVSSYVKDIIAGMNALNERRPAMPTPVLDTCFLKRFIFTVQATLVREYSKLSKRKLNDMAVMQIQIDAQNFQQLVATTFGRHNVVMPDYIVNLIKTGFYMDNREKRLGWLPPNHAVYFATDLVNWLSGGDRAFKQMLEDILKNDLNHHDTLPMDPFLH
ncbi:unnamed protein product [Phytomonas sp. EM1]|nr:unnamed protein product [Phytomonas sp. EM1]|eukprot:CCW62652.1 unnamed protein product [Phytomonas sp. isolate EM1]